MQRSFAGNDESEQRPDGHLSPATGRPTAGPRLPDERAYWDAFEDRILGAARPDMQRRARLSGPWWSLIGDFAPALAAAAVLLLLVGWLLVDSESAPASVEPITLVEGVLSPNDPLARQLILEQAPPPIGNLIAPMSEREN